MNYDDPLLRRIRPQRIYRRMIYEARNATAPLAARFASIRGERFDAWGESHEYLVDPYHTTWRNERGVEIPLARRFLSTATGAGMEFGNVLGHYAQCDMSWTVIDKYEVGPGVVNIDILDYRPPEPLDFIVSISTLEHVGWDERPRDTRKVQDAFAHLRSLLRPGASMFLTAPLGHNDALDEAVTSGRWPTTRQVTLVRELGRWVATPTVEWRPYDPRNGANVVWAAEIPAAE